MIIHYNLVTLDVVIVSDFPNHRLFSAQLSNILLDTHLYIYRDLEISETFFYIDGNEVLTSIQLFLIRKVVKRFEEDLISGIFDLYFSQSAL